MMTHSDIAETEATPGVASGPGVPARVALDPAPRLAGSIGTNTLFGILAGGTQVATRLVTVPVVIAHLGLGGYGIWSIIMTTAAYMRFGTIGVKSAFQKYVAEATGTGDYTKASQLLSTGCAALLAISVAGLIPIALFSRALAHAAGVPGEFLGATSSSISVLALIMVMSNVGAVFEAILTGGHRIDDCRFVAFWPRITGDGLGDGGFRAWVRCVLFSCFAQDYAANPCGSDQCQNEGAA